MTTVFIRIGDVMTSHQCQEPFAQLPAGTVAREQRSKSASTERQWSEQWRLRIEEDSQHRLEALQQCVCELLIRNQQLRMALSATIEPKRYY